MIIAAGLTPAWQQILVFDRLSIGHVNRAREAYWTASGKVLNTGIALHTLGGPCCIVALAGGFTGKSIEADLTATGAPARLVWSRSPSRVCTTILDRNSTETTELVENAAPVSEGEVREFVRVYGEAVRHADCAVLSGSLPAGTPKAFYRELIAETPCRVVLDASGQELLDALELRPFCVKPNREELGRTLGASLETDEALMGAMTEVVARGAEWVLVSHGARSLWALHGSTLHRFRPARIAVDNPIGSGDCLAAGIAWALRAGMAMTEAIRFGMAAAAENATAVMPARLDSRKVLERMCEVTLENP